MKTLLIHFGQLGDAVMALPAAQALRAREGGGAITVLTAPASGDIFAMAGFPTVWRVDRAAWRNAPMRALVGIADLVRRLRRERFELSVDLHSYKETNLLAWAAGIPRRVAMLRPTRTWPALLTDLPPADDTRGRLVDRYCAVLTPLGIDVLDRTPRLHPGPEAAARVAARFAGAPVLGICPGAGHPGRRWPAERFAAVARALQEDGARVVAFAGPEEAEAQLAPLRNAGVEIWNGLAVPQLAAALARCRVVLSNPTGPSHLAAAVGARVVTLGEIPMFDPVGRVWPVRAQRAVADIALDAALNATRAAWIACGNP